MAPLNTYLHERPMKALIGGRSGTGKTCLALSLLQAGYRLNILDLESKIHPLAALAYNRGYGNYLEQLTDVQTIAPAFRSIGDKIGRDPTFPVWSYIQQCLMNWPGKGSIYNWTGDDVLIIDSLTAISAASHAAAKIELSGSKDGWGRDIGMAQDAIETLFELLRADSVRCNVIVLCHLEPVQSTEYGTEMWPSLPGRKLAPKSANYFDIGGLTQSFPAANGLQEYSFTCFPRPGYGYLKCPETYVPVPPNLPSDIALGWLLEAIRRRPGPSGLTYFPQGFYG